MESYLLNVPKPSVSLVDHEEDNSTIGTVRTEDKLASLVERLIERVERLESSSLARPTFRWAEETSGESV